MNDREYLKHTFGTSNVDRIADLYIHGADFSAREKEWFLIKASRERQEVAKS
jgi:hypothetical protein